MGFKTMIVGFVILVLVHLDAGYAQEEISDEDLEAIQILDILEDLDLLEEDLDLLDSMTESGDENEL
jgi:hypothetical protein